MTAIDRQQIIEDAAKAWNDAYEGAPMWDGWAQHAEECRGGTSCDSIIIHDLVDDGRRTAATALPVIVAAVLKPIRELHRDQFQFCRDCDADYPCPTIQLCDEIESSAKGGE